MNTSRNALFARRGFPTAEIVKINKITKLYTVGYYPLSHVIGIHAKSGG